MIGTSLGPYKIIEQLGAGGMGEVPLLATVTTKCPRRDFNPHGPKRRDGEGDAR